jgi:hypothetical protein
MTLFDAFRYPLIRVLMILVFVAPDESRQIVALLWERPTINNVTLN